MPWIRTDIELETRPRLIKQYGRWRRTLIIQCDGCGKVFPRRFGLARNMAGCKGAYCSYRCQAATLCKDAEYISNLSAASKANWSDPVVRARRQKGLAEAAADPAVAARVAAGVRRSFEDQGRLARAQAQLAEVRARPEVKARVSESLRKTWGTAERRQQKSKQFRAMWADLAFRNSQSVAMKAAADRPEVRAAKSEAVRRWQSDPTNRAAWRAKVNASLATDAVLAKRRATFRDRDVFNRSDPEDRLHERLCEVFGRHDVLRWQMIGRWEIDFYVASIATYMQLDGAYWHGLDRALEDIAKQPGKHPKRILETYSKDRRQDEYCRAHGIRLVRITDLQLIELERNGTVNKWIHSTLMSDLPKMRPS